MINYKVLQISYDQTKPFILNIHYAKRMPSITYSFGLYMQNELVGVVTYGSPASQSLCRGIAGDEFKKIVLELNRLVLKNNIKNEASFLVSNSLIDQIKSININKDPRGREKPSDHTPIEITLI